MRQSFVDVGDGVSFGELQHVFWKLILEYSHFVFCVVIYQDGDPFNTAAIEWYIWSVMGGGIFEWVVA